MTTCQGCGTENPPKKGFCSSCGRVLPASDTPPKNVSFEDIQSSSPGDMFSSLFGISQKQEEHAPGREQSENGSNSRDTGAADTSKAASGSDNGTGQISSRAEALKLVAKAGSKAIVKSVSLSLLVLGPGFAMLMMGITIPGMIWLFCGSFGLMAWTYRKPWRLGVISCLIPPVAAAVCYLIQFALFGDNAPPIELLGPAIAVGIGVGYWRAQTHKVSKGEDGGIIAERTIGYLLVWVAAYAATQILGMVTRETHFIHAGLVTGAFSTVMLAVVSLVIWRQYKTAKGIASAIFILSVVGMTGWADEARADDLSDLKDIIDVVRPKLEEIEKSIPKSRKCITRVGSNKFHKPNNFTHEFSYGSRCDAGGNNRILVTALLVNLSIGDRNINKQIDRIEKNARQSAGNSARYAYQSGGFGDKSVVLYNAVGPNYSGRQFSKLGRAYCTINAILNGWEARVVVDHTPVKAYDISEAPSCVLAKRGMAELMDAIASQGGQSPGNGGIGSNDDRDGKVSTAITPEEAAKISAAIATVLIAAGIAVNVAQALAAAIANALQAGIQLTSEEIQAAIADALLNRDSTAAPAGSAEPDNEAESNAPPNVTLTERVRPPRNTPVLDDDPTSEASSGKPTTNTEGGHEQTNNQAQSAPNVDDQTDGQPEDDKQAAADKLRRENLTTVITNTINKLPDSDRYSALMARLADIHNRGNLAELEQLWGELRGERQQQLERLAQQARQQQSTASTLQTLETGASVVLYGSGLALGAGLTAASGGLIGGTLTAGQALVSTLIGTGTLATIGAVKGGVKAEGGNIQFDGTGAGKGAAIGLITASGALMRGIPAGGNVAVMVGKSTFAAGVTHTQIYERVLQETGNPKLAKERADQAALTTAVFSLAGEGYAEHARGTQAAAGKLAAQAPVPRTLWSLGSRISYRQALAARNAVVLQTRTTIAKTATSLLGKTLSNIATADKDKDAEFRPAFLSAVYSQAMGYGAGKGVGRSEEFAKKD